MAMLRSKCGDWTFYDHTALQIAALSFANLMVEAAPSQSLHADAAPSSDQRSVLFDGFSIEQWASYAKRKAHIASAVCKENGSLKAKINATPIIEGTGSHECSGVGHKTSTSFDSIFASDPWRSGSAGLAQEKGSVVSVCESNNDEAWAKWRGTSSISESVATAVPTRHMSRGLQLQQVRHRESAWADDSAVAVEGSLAFSLGAKVVTQRARETALKGAGTTRGYDHLNGDWRVLPSGDFQVIHDKFPQNPFRTTPYEYVKARWPASRVLFKGSKLTQNVSDDESDQQDENHDGLQADGKQGEEQVEATDATEKCIEEAMHKSAERMDAMCEKLRKEFIDSCA